MGLAGGRRDRTWGHGYYTDLLPRVVAETDPTRPYWPGSPYSGRIDLPVSLDGRGCKHIWDVWNTADYSRYRDHVPRFVSEFGWQAPLTWATLTGSVHDDPLPPDSPGMLHHQKASDGNGKLARGLAPHFPEPTTMEDIYQPAQPSPRHHRRGRTLPFPPRSLHGHRRLAAQRLLASDLVGRHRR